MEETTGLRERVHALERENKILKAATEQSGTIQKLYTDAIERLQASDEALKRSREFLQSILDTLDSHIAILDTEGTIIITNQAWQGYEWPMAMSGKTYAQGENYVELLKHVHESDVFSPAAVIGGIRNVLDGKVDWFEMEYNASHEGTRRWFLLKIQQFENQGDSRLLVEHQFITRQKNMQEALQESEKDLRASNATKDRLLALIAHDLRGPIGNIISVLEMVLSDVLEDDPVERDNLLKDLATSARNTYELLENLLYWARSQRDEIDYRPEAIQVSMLAERTISLLDPQLKKKEQQVCMDCPENLIVNADLNMISTVFRNLLTNAVKFTPRKGRITINASRDDGMIRVDIIDTGVGIPGDRFDMLFSPEMQVSTYGTEREKGTGLGLLLCKDFISRNKGRINVQSRMGEGSVFSFWLPVAEDFYNGSDDS